jgi:hypothetical protein
MAARDIRVITNFASVHQFQTKANNTSIKVGEPAMVVDTNYAGPLTDGKPVIDTDQFLGIATKLDTVTASAAGTCDIHVPIAMKTVLRGKVKTTTDINTAAKIAALLNEDCLFDLTGTTYTIDVGTTDGGSGLKIKAIDNVKNTVDVWVKERVMGLIT